MYPSPPLFNCYRRFLRFVRLAFATAAEVECTEIRKRKTTTDDLLRMTIVNRIVGHRLQSVGWSTPILPPRTGSASSYSAICSWKICRRDGNAAALAAFGTETVSLDFFLVFPNRSISVVSDWWGIGSNQLLWDIIAPTCKYLIIDCRFFTLT